MKLNELYFNLSNGGFETIIIRKTTGIENKLFVYVVVNIVCHFTLIISVHCLNLKFTKTKDQIKIVNLKSIFIENCNIIKRKRHII